jgi:hypothetical protein
VGRDGAKLTQSRIRDGRWEGHLNWRGEGAPEVELWHGERQVASVAAAAGAAKGDWTLSAAIPASLISDGVQTVLLRDTGSGEVLGHFAIMAGSVLDDDLRAEVDLLRAELDMLRKAFRRHCIESGQ